MITAHIAGDSIKFIIDLFQCNVQPFHLTATERHVLILAIPANMQIVNNKDKIRRCLDTQLTTSGNDIVQINRHDFDRILNRADHCFLIIITGSMPNLAEQLRSGLESLNIESVQNVIMKVNHSPASELSCNDLVALLRVVNGLAPTANIVWGCGADEKLAEGDCSIVLLIGASME